MMTLACNPHAISLLYLGRQTGIGVDAGLLKAFSLVFFSFSAWPRIERRQPGDAGSDVEAVLHLQAGYLQRKSRRVGHAALPGPESR